MLIELLRWACSWLVSILVDVAILMVLQYLLGRIKNMMLILLFRKLLANLGLGGLCFGVGLWEQLPVSSIAK